jgi:V8-like Glu-specific endopeptidase
MRVSARRQRLAEVARTIGLAVALGMAAHAPPADARATNGDRRVEANNPDLPALLVAALQAVAFIDAPGGDAKAVDGGTAFLVADCLLLTAAHVIDAITPAKAPTTAIRVRFPALTGPDGELATFTAQLEVRGGGLWRDPVSDDWALIRLTQAPDVPPLGMAAASCCELKNLPMAAAMAGFPADKFNAEKPPLWVDPQCQLVRRLAIPVFATSCQATSGNSGGPILIEAPGRWLLAAMLTRAPAPTRKAVIGNSTSYALALEGRIQRAIARAAKTPCPATASSSEPIE